MEYEIIEYGIYIHAYDRIIIQGHCDGIVNSDDIEFPVNLKTHLWCYLTDSGKTQMYIAGATVFSREIKDVANRNVDLLFRCGRNNSYLIYWPMVGNKRGVLAKIRFIKGFPIDYDTFKITVLDPLYLNILKMTAHM